MERDGVEGIQKGGCPCYVDKEKSGPRINMMCHAAAQQTKIDRAGNRLWGVQ